MAPSAVRMAPPAGAAERLQVFVACGAWVLALPDPEEPITHVWAEADADAEARRLAQEYVRRIRQMVR